MASSWVPPRRNFVKVNVRASTIADPLPNGNINGVGILARNNRMEYLWGLMGPMKDIGFLELQLWAIHKAMVTAYEKRIPRVIIETDNVHAYDILLEEDDDMIEEEGLEEVVRQINNLSRTYNGTRQEDGTKWDCELVLVNAAKNRAALCMAQYGMTNFESLVEVPRPFEELQEQLNMDIGLGPRADFLEVQPNFGRGEIVAGRVGGNRVVIDLTGEAGRGRGRRQ
ncbi:hypothetical protein ACET3Z_013280 [Daucus carota]